MRLSPASCPPAAAAPVEVLRVGSLFSGCGGLELGLSRALPLECAFLCDSSAPARRVLAARHPGVPIFDDVRDVKGDPLRVDMICGGFPCQDVSQAGSGAGLDGARSGLWFEMGRIIGEVRPRWVVIENVAALCGRGLDRVLADLHGMGYAAEWQVIEALAVGALHIRARVFIVAYPDGLNAPHVFRDPWRVRVAFRTNRARLWGEGPAGLSRTISRDEMSPKVRRERLTLLGNAVVPQVAEVVGAYIAAAVPGDPGGRVLTRPASGTWKLPRSGAMRGGILHETRPLVGIGEAKRWHAAACGPFGVTLPTPTASMMTTGDLEQARFAGDDPRRPNYGTAVKLWPTATVGDANGSGSRNTPNSKAHPGTSLTDAVREDGGRGRLWATPRASDHRSGLVSDEVFDKNSRPLCEQVAREGGSSHLSPHWVTWLQGFPMDWLEVADE